ncbi:hypothetical protein OUZ56_018638 [Daphnia magna]|uniref:Uncharacterized protein n=1 Tax=Daphnia magna TaxID=35525 RepID=A0ABQ9Z9C9_9CRUS|nr:hypothetical protein OUZ56_018638 [Daphnia magna]
MSTVLPASPTPGTSNERSNMVDPGCSQQIDGMEIKRATSLPLAKNFRVVDGGSIMRKDILFDGLGFRYGV